MSPRERRLAADLRDIEALAARLDAMSFTSEGQPPDRYLVAFSATGLAPGGFGPVLAFEHRVALYLHLDYPRRPPLAVWQTPIFHPNLLGPEQHGGVCIGAWSPQESLADLVERLVDLASWRAFAVEDALNDVAAQWARAHDMRPGRPVVEVLSVA